MPKSSNEQRMNANAFCSVMDRTQYRQFLFSLDWLGYNMPYLAVLGCGQAATGQKIKAEVRKRFPGLLCFEQWQDSDDFARAFSVAPGSTVLLDFQKQDKKVTDAQVAGQLLFYRDKAVGQRLQLICLASVRQLDAIHREAFDFMAAASFVHAFGESRQVIPAHQYLTTAKTTTINE